MKNNKTFLIFLILSILFHIFVIFLGFYHIKKEREIPETSQVLTLELLKVSDINNVKTQKVQRDKTINNEDAKKVESKKATEIDDNIPSPQKEDIKEKSEEIKKPEEEIKKDAEPLPSKKIEEKKVTEKPKEQKKEDLLKKPEKKKPNPIAPVKKSKPITEEELDDILKNLESSSDGENQKSKKVNRQQNDNKRDAFGNLEDILEQSLTQDEIIKQQIMKNWIQPIGSKSHKISLKVIMNLMQDGTIESYKIIDINCPAENIVCEVTKNSIERAVIVSSPLKNLEQSDYFSWKNITVTFFTNEKLM